MLKFQLRLLLCWIMLFPVVSSGASRTAIKLNLVPQPKEIRQVGGYFVFTPGKTVIRINPQAERDDRFAVQMLQNEIQQDIKQEIPVTTEAAQHTIHVAIYPQDQQIQKLCKKRGIVLDEELGREGYFLSIRSREIVVTALTSTGLFYGIQTLRQIIRGNVTNNRIRGALIRDFPTFKFRGMQDDISRGPVPTKNFLKAEIRRLAELKYNYLTYYTEHIFKTRAHPEFAPPGGSLTAADIQELVEYAQKYHIELVGNFQAFGHFYNILKHPQFEHLGENDWVISPALEESYQLLEDIISEIAAAYPSHYFNVNSDETWGLGEGPSKALLTEKGIAGVYADHLNRLLNILTKHDKQMMMWGDIALQHPEIIERLPKNIIMLSWGYGANESFTSSIAPFRKAGFDVIVCPGVSCWNRIFPDFHTARVNIRNYVRDGAQQGALGMLNTSWDDDGENLFSYNWYGVAYGADQAWNPGATDDISFNRRFSGAIYGDQQNQIGTALEQFGTLHQKPELNKLSNKAFWEDVIPGRREKKIVKLVEWQTAVPIIQQVESLLENVNPLQYAADLEYFHFAVDRVKFIIRIRQSIVAASENYRKACFAQSHRDSTDALLRAGWLAIAKTRQALADLKARYSQLWLAENRFYWLAQNLAKYDNLATELDEIEILISQAITRYELGSPLPAPDDIRLTAKTLVGDFLNTWLICGGFPNNEIGGSTDNEEHRRGAGWNFDFLTTIGGEQNAHPIAGQPVPLPTNGAISWKLIQSDQFIINFNEHFGKQQGKVAYAFTTIQSPTEKDIVFSVGSDDGIKIFLNGKEVHNNSISRGTKLDDDFVPVHLVKGQNRILVKVDQGTGDWGFCFRLMGAKIRKIEPVGYELQD